MKTYFLNLKSKIGELNNRIENEPNSVTKAYLSYELIKLKKEEESFLTNLFGNYGDEDIEAFINQDKIEKYRSAKMQADAKNLDSHNRNKQANEAAIARENAAIQKILDDDPNAESDFNAHTENYQKIKEKRKMIEKFQDKLDNEKYKKVLAVNYLDKSIVDDVILEVIDGAETNVNAGKESYYKLKDKVTKYVPIEDLETERENPIKSKLEQLNHEGKLLNFPNFWSEYDKMIELTSNSTMEVAISQHTEMVLPIEKALSKREKDTFSQAVIDAGLSDLADEFSGGFNEPKNIKEYNRIKGILQPFVNDEGVAPGITRLLQKMESLGFVPDGAYSGESKHKEYGFTNFLKAKKEFINAVNKDDFDIYEFNEKWNKLKEEERKIDSMFDEIKLYLGDELDTMPTNVDSIRNSEIPLKYRNQLALQEKFNNLYITLAFIKEHKGELDNYNAIDSFGEDSLKFVRDALEKEYKENNIDAKLKDKSTIQAIMELTKKGEMPVVFDPYPYTRSIELYTISQQTEIYKKENTLILGGVKLETGQVKRAVEKYSRYFDGANVEQTLQNIFVGGPEFSYEKAIVPITGNRTDLLTGITAVEEPTLIERLANVTDATNIQEMFYEALNAVKQYNNVYKQEGETKRKITPEQMLSAFQELTVKIMMTRDLNAKNQSGERLYPKDFVKQLNNAVKDYRKLEELSQATINVDNAHRRDLLTLMNKGQKLMKKEAKSLEKELNKKEKLINKEEKKLNKRISAIEKKVAKLNAKQTKRHSDERAAEIQTLIQEKTEKQQRITANRNDRLTSLRKDYEEGKISKYYFKTRTEQIKNNEDLSQIPLMHLCDDKKYKNFKTYAKKVLNLSREDYRNQELIERHKSEYIELMEKLTAEKSGYLADKVAATKNMSMSKVLDSNTIIKKEEKEEDKISNIGEVAKKQQIDVQLEENKEFVLEHIEEQDLSISHNKEATI